MVYDKISNSLYSMKVSNLLAYFIMWKFVYNPSIIAWIKNYKLKKQPINNIIVG